MQHYFARLRQTFQTMLQRGQRLPLWQRITIIGSLVVLLVATFFGVPFGIGLLQSHPATVTTPNTGASVTLTTGHPAGVATPLPSKQGTGSTKAPTAVTPLHFTPAMPPFTIPLTPGKATQVTSTDGSITISIPANALSGVPTHAAESSIGQAQSTSAASVAATPAPTQLAVTQIAPASGSTNSGGVVSFGTYLLQLQDSTGHEVTTSGLQAPVSLAYHLPHHLPYLPQRLYAVLNQGSLPTAAHAAHLGAPQVQAATLDGAGSTVSAAVALGGSHTTTAAALSTSTQAPLTTTSAQAAGSGSATVGWLTNAPEAYFGKADSVHADLQSGGLSTDVPIDLPAGPGGLTPPVHLAYTSGSVNGAHGLQSAADWVGMGWSLDMGAITWSEVKRGSCPGCTIADYESSWSLSDPYGTSATLIPPNTAVATYYDDTINTPVNAPTVWHTANESHVKVVSYTNPTVDTQHFPPASYTSQPPCFRVWLTNGIMEEFGCTLDSRQFFPGWITQTTNYVSAWKLDLITDPNGNQIHISYVADMVTAPGGTNPYPRDVVPATIQWDSPACHNAQTACTGTSWQPQMQVTFNALNQVATPNGPTCGAPNPDGSRCDDPQAVGVAAAPLVESTKVLNSLAVQASPTGNQSAWNTLRSYQFRYSQSSWSPNGYDSISGLPSGAAGQLLLQQVQEYGTDGATTYPAQTFSYSSGMQHYQNDFYAANQDATTATLNGYYGYTAGHADAWESTSMVAGGYQVEAVYGQLYLKLQPGTVPLFNCLIGGWDHFLSLDPLCEGQTTLDLEGFLYPLTKPMPQNVNAVELYRCRFASGDHFSSLDPLCGGQILDELLGYLIGVPALQPLMRYYSATLGDFWITSGTVTPTYNRNGPALGLLSPSAQTGLTTLNQCLLTTNKHLLSDSPGECASAGGQLGRVEGYLPTTATGAYTVGVYRCYDPANGLHFASDDPACEGQHVEYQVGDLTPPTINPCGVSWNYGCYQWDLTNHAYLSGIDRGLGDHQSFSWVEAHNNTHNVPSSLNVLDPTVCTGVQRGNGSCAVADDGAWSQEVLASQIVTTQSATNVLLTTTTNLSYNLTTLSSVMCTSCQVGMYWGDENDGDYLDFYNTQFKGFALVQETRSDGATIQHHFVSTEGIGVFDAALVNGQSQCQNGFRDSNNNPIACTTSAAWDLGNAASGRETQTDSFDPQGKLLGRSVTVYQATCPPSGISASPAFSWYGTWDGHLVAELDPSNPATVCDVQVQRTTAYSVDGVTTAPTSSNVPTTITTYSYDSYGRVTQSETTGNSGTATDIITQTQYVWNDAVSTAGAVPTGTYLIDTVASQVMQDPQNNPVQCTYHDYDGQSFATGQQSGMTRGLETGTERYTLCAPLQASNWVPQVMSYNANGDVVSTTDADGRTGVAGHVATTGSCTGFTACHSYDSNYGVVPVSSTNVLNQTTSTAYPTTAATGFGLWPASTTNANGQTSSRTYDALGRVTTTTAPGEGAGLSTGTLSYPLPWCPTTGAALACAEVDATQRVDATTTVTSRHFYDGLGRPVESRKPGPSGQDVIQYALYNDLGLLVFVSQGYFVPAYTGVAGASASSTPDGAQHGVATIYDSMGRVTSTTDLAGKTTTTSYTTVCAPAGTNDTGCYSATTVTDANGHQSASYSDALGRLVYTQQWTGRVADGNLTLYRTIQQKYDVAGNVVETDYSDGSHKATASYDAIGRKTSFTDPDLGTYNLTYDPNSNLLSSNDPRGASGSLYQGYDGLNRLKGKSTHSDGSSALATYSYDSTASGNQGVGHLTGEMFASGPNQSTTGNYVYAYDARGRQTGWTMALGSQSYTFSTGYNDADQPLTLTYPDGDVVTTSYSAQDWLAGVTEAQSGTTTTLLNSLVYSGAPGATMKPIQAVIGNNTYKWTLGYDSAVRLTHTTVAQVSNNATLFDQSRTFDNVGNVITTNTTLSQGTDNQAFCYDALNRLTWAGSTGTAPTGCTSPTTGTLTGQGAKYTQPYSYDVLNRFTQGPLGAGYVYGDATHLDAVTSAPSYTASYDAAGSMITRNGQQLGYDVLRRLITWQNTVNNPTQTATYAYNGEGERVQQSVTNTGTLTTTSYIGAEEEITKTGSTTTTLKYYNAGPVTAIRVNGTLSYEVNDNLGSVSQALSATGGVTATQLYAPYGSVRYTLGTMPSSHGFTDQRQDASGLNYDHARYYDPGLGQFITADNAMGDNRYGYVLGNPETVTDPSGNCPWCIGALIGAVVGAAISYGSQVVANVQAHGLSSSAFTQVDGGAIAKAALAGAIIGAGGALLEGVLGATVGAKMLVGGITGAAGQMLDNAMNNRPLFDDVAKAAVIGTVTAGLTHYGGKFLKGKFGKGKVGGDAPDVACGNSFQGDTPVTTPTGSQAIDTLKVGDQVTAYDSTTGKAQPETVQHVFINHDDNLLDVTIVDASNAKPTTATDAKSKQQDAAVAAHGSQAPPTQETIHTTTEHPFLTNDRGFVDAVKLVAGEHVTKLDGSLSVVVSVTVVPGQAVRYNLTVQDEHTYAVGTGQWVVHNCGVNGDPDPAMKVDGQPNLYKGKPYDPAALVADHFIPPAKPRIVWTIKSDMFRQFIGDDNIQQWRKVMETWTHDNYYPIENHYWQLGNTSSIYHYHPHGE